MSAIQYAGEPPIGVLCFYLSTERHFSPVMELGRIYHTGETFAVDKKGRVISPSRFNDELKKLGLIPMDYDDATLLSMRDPGGDLTKGYRPTVPWEELPFPKAIVSLLAHESGSTIEPYRDYRGVNNIAAWLWDENLGLGLLDKHR